MKIIIIAADQIEQFIGSSEPGFNLAPLLLASGDYGINAATLDNPRYAQFHAALSELAQVDYSPELYPASDPEVEQ